ncbi:MAG TPA: response regulator [Tepidisphaeraceae bacterium]|jgi:DNA-binding response OmpR family regulator|nr:response regulator [Tepidisphaeraceae bacterium]
MLLYEDVLECIDRPLVESNPEKSEPQPKVKPSVGQKSSRILIMESDPASLEALREMCGVLGYLADEVGTVAEGMAYLERSRPRCMLLAMMLPDGSGVSLLRHVRDRFLPIKVAVMFNSAEPRAMLDEVNRLRADGLFLRPLNIPSIASWLWLANN